MIGSVVICVAIFCSFPLAIYKYLTWHYSFWKRRGVNGPKPQLLVGSFPSLLSGKQHLVYDFDDIYHCYRRKEQVVGVFMTRKPELLILDPQIANEIMVKNFGSFRDNVASKWIHDRKKDKFACRNPFLATGEEWKRNRVEAMGGITVKRLTAAYPIWQDAAKKLRKYLKEKTKAEPVEIETRDLSQRFTTAIMADFLWGLDSRSFSTDPENQNPILDMGRRMLLNSFGAVSLYFQLSVVPFLKRFFSIRFYAEETDTFFSLLTEDAILIRQRKKNKERVDYLNYVTHLKKQKNLSHDDIMGHILTVFLDGYETAANVIHHTLFYLAKNPGTQEGLRSDILKNLHGREFLMFDELNSLQYLDQCVHETIRLITPIPVFSRICTEQTDLELRDGKKLILKPGDIVTIPIFSYHHDPEYFPQPYQYKPDRFDYQSHSELTRNGIFMPFGDGPRKCLGIRIGLLEVKTCIVEILKNFRVKCCAKTLEEKRPDSDSFILGLEGDFWLVFEPLRGK